MPVPWFYPILFGKPRGFLPSDIANLAAWYRPDQGITISTGVSQWNDLSGNGRNLTQGTGAQQPAYSSSSGANGRDGVTFDGSDDNLSVTFTSIAQPIHIFAVMKTTDVTASGLKAYISGGALGERLMYLNGPIDIYMGGSIINFAHSDTASHWLFESLANGASSSILRGNGSPGTGNAGSTGLSGVMLGKLVSQNCAGVVISEVAIYSAQISGTNLTNLRGYFSSRYGVTTS